MTAENERGARYYVLEDNRVTCREQLDDYEPRDGRMVGVVLHIFTDEAELVLCEVTERGGHQRSRWDVGVGVAGELLVNFLAALDDGDHGTLRQVVTLAPGRWRTVEDASVQLAD